MPTYRSPGVCYEEVEAGSRPIEGVGTAVAAFVGFAANSPMHEPILVTNWSQFVTTYGDFVEGAYLASAVYGFFANGGGICYVIRTIALPSLNVQRAVYNFALVAQMRQPPPWEVALSGDQTLPPAGAAPGRCGPPVTASSLTALLADRPTIR